jgi:hypothetical protein
MVAHPLRGTRRSVRQKQTEGKILAPLVLRLFATDAALQYLRRANARRE